MYGFVFHEDLLALVRSQIISQLTLLRNGQQE